MNEFIMVSKKCTSKDTLNNGSKWYNVHYVRREDVLNIKGSVM